MADKDTEFALSVATKCLDEHKASDISFLEVSEFTPFATYYVLATCLNIRQLDAMIGHLEDEFEKNKIEIFAKEGEPESGWMIIQGGDVIVHLFLAINRKEINLEGLIADMAKKAEKAKAKKSAKKIEE